MDVSQTSLHARVSLSEGLELQAVDGIYQWLGLDARFEPCFEYGLRATLPWFARHGTVVLLLYTLPPYIRRIEILD